MRYIFIDLIRAGAIVFLLSAHIGQEISNPIGRFCGVYNFYYVSLGGLAVTFFLIVSGIVLELQHGNKKIVYSLFIIKRWLRIYPVYYMSIVVGVAAYFYKTYIDTGSIATAFSSLGFSDIILSMTGLYSFAGKWGGPFVATSWFIGLIMSLYLLFPFLSKFIKRNPHITFFTLLFISGLLRFILGRYGILPQRPIDWFPLCRISEFALGMYLAVILPTGTWQCLNSMKRTVPIISFISAISFPLFLIHFPLIFTITYFTEHGINQLLAILIFLILSCVLSWIALLIDRNIPREVIFKRLSDKLIADNRS